MINARSETVRDKPLFKRAIRHRRCVIVSTAYYEWLPTSNGKQPYCIRAVDHGPLLMAGIYENATCAIMTRAARSDLQHIHDRMPVLLPRVLVDHYIAEFAVTQAAIDAAELLPLCSYPVTHRVGSPRFSGPECMTPVLV